MEIVSVTRSYFVIKNKYKISIILIIKFLENKIKNSLLLFKRTCRDGLLQPAYLHLEKDEPLHWLTNTPTIIFTRWVGTGIVLIWQRFRHSHYLSSSKLKF